MFTLRIFWLTCQSFFTWGLHHHIITMNVFSLVVIDLFKRKAVRLQRKQSSATTTCTFFSFEVLRYLLPTREGRIYNHGKFINFSQRSYPPLMGGEYLNQSACLLLKKYTSSIMMTFVSVYESQSVIVWGVCRCLKVKKVLNIQLRFDAALRKLVPISNNRYKEKIEKCINQSDKTFI